ncbi:alkaline phosphatase [Desulfosediminicola ganghwensis]|uniref:alkaline phosphatase n=1 Tax=Desulfosediminicola ganghwensis TaxID=2569540 RepID=UPI0010AC481E|nr:alkaline phosphatase [Desulfosediminicola ganghwensis]
MQGIKKTVGLCMVALFISAPAIGAEQPKYVFYMIGDGLGASQRQFSEFFVREKEQDNSKELLMNTFEVAGLNSTYAADTLITDSAAAGTALASGVKTNKGVIGKDAKGNDVKTLVEAAELEGMATGIITTTRLTHATPAAFAAHNISRNNENEIAEDYLKSGVDFLAGGGIRHFIPKSMKIENGDAIGKTIKSKRKDEKNLVAAFHQSGYSTFIGMEGAKAFGATDFTKEEKVVALFTYTHMPYEIERINTYSAVPSLAEMTQAGIEVLQKDNDGFFMMVEGGRIDHAAHANDPTGVIYDTIAFDEAIKVAYDFYQQHPKETLIVVVGDHETGGMGLGMDSKGYKLDMSQLLATRISVEDTLAYGKGQYKGDKAAYLAFLKNEFGLDNLNESEAARLERAMTDADAGQTSGYYKVNPAALTAAHILSERANINWTTTIHTATMIPMSATGVEAQRFAGFKDNTEIADTMADLLNFTL